MHPLNSIEQAIEVKMLFSVFIVSVLVERTWDALSIISSIKHCAPNQMLIKCVDQFCVKTKIASKSSLANFRSKSSMSTSIGSTKSPLAHAKYHVCVDRWNWIWFGVETNRKLYRNMNEQSERKVFSRFRMADSTFQCVLVVGAPSSIINSFAIYLPYTSASVLTEPVPYFVRHNRYSDFGWLPAMNFNFIDFARTNSPQQVSINHFSLHACGRRASNRLRRNICKESASREWIDGTDEYILKMKSAQRMPQHSSHADESRHRNQYETIDGQLWNNLISDIVSCDISVWHSRSVEFHASLEGKIKTIGIRITIGWFVVPVQRSLSNNLCTAPNDRELKQQFIAALCEVDRIEAKAKQNEKKKQKQNCLFDVWSGVKNDSHSAHMQAVALSAKCGGRRRNLSLTVRYKTVCILQAESVQRMRRKPADILSWRSTEALSMFGTSFFLHFQMTDSAGSYHFPDFDSWTQFSMNALHSWMEKCSPIDP